MPGGGGRERGTPLCSLCRPVFTATPGSAQQFSRMDEEGSVYSTLPTTAAVSNSQVNFCCPGLAKTHFSPKK